MQPPKITSAGIPEAMKLYAQFILWKYLPSKTVAGEWEKLPCDRHGNVISAHDPQCWMTAHDALHMQHHGAFGVGFVFTERDPLWFIDLDNAWNGERWSPMALEIHAWFAGCAYEVSASGRGLHLFGSGLAPAHRKSITGPGGKLEFYTEGRFVALTGLSAGGSAAGDYTHALTAFVDAYGLRIEPTALLMPGGGLDGPAPGCTAPADDNELLAIIQNSKGSAGAAFGDKVHPWDLFIGNEGAIAAVWPQPGRKDGCPFDRTRAESALMSHLAFYTGGHRSRMIRLFMRSALFRPLNHSEAGGYRLTRIVDHAQGSVRSHYNVVRGSMVAAGPLAGLPVTDTKRVNFMGISHVDTINAKVLPPLRWLVEDLVTPGVYLLVGKPKKGKSWLALDMCLAVATGGHVLGRKCEQGPVLYFALEENERRVQDRLRKLMPRNMVVGTDQLRIATVADDIQPMDRGFVENLEYTLSLHPEIRLVVIDTLAMIRPAPAKNETLYMYDRKAIDPFIKLCGKYPNLTVFMIHHTKKAETTDPYEMASGSNGLLGAVDGSFIMHHDKDKDCETLVSKNRDRGESILPVKFKMPKWETFDPDNGEYENLRSEKKRIVDFLKTTSAGFTRIYSELDLNKNNTYSWLKQLERDKFISKNGDIYNYNAPY